MDERDKLLQTEKELFSKYIEEPELMEEKIRQCSSDAAKQITSYDIARFMFEGDLYVAKNYISVKNSKRHIDLVIANEERRKIAGNKYVPYTIQAEIDNNYTMYENIKATLEVFLKHISGTSEPVGEIE